MSKARGVNAELDRVLCAVGARIRQLRKQRCWTLEHAAEMMDVDFRHLQRIEIGEINVTIKTLVRIARSLDASVYYLLAVCPLDESADDGANGARRVDLSINGSTHDTRGRSP